MKANHLKMAGAVGLAMMALAATGRAVDFFHNRTRAPSFHCIPASPHTNYQSLRLTKSGHLIAIAPVDQPVYEPGDAEGVLRKRFFSLRTSLEVSGLSLDRVGISLRNDGKHVVTGRLSYDGGPGAARLGAHAIIRVRGYAGTPQHPGELDGMRLLFETSRREFVRRDELRSLSLLPQCVPNQSDWSDLQKIHRIKGPQQYGDEALEEIVKEEFSSLTHVEIVLEHREAL